jgi:hypothetical protein
MRQESLPQAAAQLQAQTGASLLVALPEDEELRRLSEEGGPLQAMPPSNRLVQAMDRLLFDAGAPTLKRATPNLI